MPCSPWASACCTSYSDSSLQGDTVARRAIQAQERSAAMRRSAAARRSANPSDALALDPVIHERVRLGIISALAVNDILSFGDLKKLLETTDGNLSVHARK